MFLKFLNVSKGFQTFESALAFLMYFLQQIVILNIVSGFCVFIWEHTLNVFLNIVSNIFKTNSKNVPEV